MRRVIVSDGAGVGPTIGYLEEYWAAHRGAGSQDGSDNVVRPPLAQAKHPSYGVTTEELAEAQRRFCNYARFRISDTGARQYSGSQSQAFESMAPQRIILELRDELADAVNYLTFLDIQLSRWQRRLEGIA